MIIHILSHSFEWWMAKFTRFGPASARLRPPRRSPLWVPKRAPEIVFVVPVNGGWREGLQVQGLEGDILPDQEKKQKKNLGSRKIYVRTLKIK